MKGIGIFLYSVTLQINRPVFSVCLSAVKIDSKYLADELEIKNLTYIVAAKRFQRLPYMKGVNTKR